MCNEEEMSCRWLKVMKRVMLYGHSVGNVYLSRLPKRALLSLISPLLWLHDDCWVESHLGGSKIYMKSKTIPRVCSQNLNLQKKKRQKKKHQTNNNNKKAIMEVYAAYIFLLSVAGDDSIHREEKLLKHWQSWFFKWMLHSDIHLSLFPPSGPCSVWSVSSSRWIKVGGEVSFTCPIQGNLSPVGEINHSILHFFVSPCLSTLQNRK